MHLWLQCASNSRRGRRRAHHLPDAGPARLRPGPRPPQRPPPGRPRRRVPPRRPVRVLLGAAGAPGTGRGAELRAAEPVLPLRLVRDRTTLSTLAGIAIGVAMFGSSVFLGQYLQISRGYSPTAAGLLTLPMVGGLLLSSTVSGILITRSGRWKGHLTAGSLLVVLGFALLGNVDHETDMVLLGAFLFVLGVGMGMTMQNLVLAVQNTVAARDLGAASSAVAFRSLGGTIGVAVLGAVLDARVGELTARGLAGVPGVAPGSAGAGLADLADAPPAGPGAGRGGLRRRDRADLRRLCRGRGGGGRGHRLHP
ncbi:MFS transporter [Geodermatophilus sp. SYSU D01176]